MRHAILALLIVAAATGPAVAQVNAVAAPLPGSAQRAAILDALRPLVMRELRSPVEFVVRQVRVEQGWALLIADSQRPGGGAIDTSRVPRGDELDNTTVYAILRFRNGRWTVHDHVVGPTDVWFCGMRGPPPSLLPC